MNESIIRTDGLTKRYGDILAVDELSLEVPRGQVFGLLGPNGSGKTTTMGMLLGLVKPTMGNFSLFGASTSHQDALHRVGAIVETPSFYPYLSGRNNLAYFQGITGRGDQRELDDLLDKVGLADRADSRLLNRAEVELDSHLSLWQQARSGDYSYEYNVLCECSDNFGQPVKVTVTNGEIKSVVYAESGEMGKAGDPPVISGSPRYHTIDRLFDVIQEAIDNEADQITVSYDSEFGYPTNIDIDRNINAIDDEYVLTATRFLPR